MRVLIVDSDAMEVARLRFALEGLGHAVLTVEEGRAGLEIASAGSVRLVIFNAEMLDLRGVEFCRALRQSKAGRDAYVILLGGRQSTSETAAALGAGADDFLAKPIELGDLPARLRAGMRTIQLRRKLAASQIRGQRLKRRLAELDGQLQLLSTTDDLTGLMNRRTGLARLDEEWQLAVRYDQPFAVAMLDIDLFKQMNEARGHETADCVLNIIGELLARTARDTDIVIRHGGEEFLIILPQQSEAEAALAAERFRAAIEKAHLGVTISAGVAARNSGPATPDQLLRQADAALYAAKRNGRNRVEQASVIRQQPSAA
jgi:two-component system chemotaxis response regulator CheY